jgi:hypothetical protein
MITFVIILALFILLALAAYWAWFYEPPSPPTGGSPY